MCRYYVWICRYCPGIDHRNHRHVTAFYSGPEYFCGFSHSRCVDCVVQAVSVSVLCVQCTSFYVMIWRELELLNSPPSDKNDTKLEKSSVTGIVQACYSNAIMIHVIITKNAVFICLYFNQLEKLEAAKAAWLVCLSLISLTGFFLVLLGPSGSIFTDLTGPYLVLLVLT